LINNMIQVQHLTKRYAIDTLQGVSVRIAQVCLGLSRKTYLRGSLDVSGGLVDLELHEELLDGRLSDGHELAAVHREVEVGLAVLVVRGLLDGHETLSGLKKNLIRQISRIMSMKL